MSTEEAARLYSELVVNIVMPMKVFITPASLTHTLSNDARYKLQTVEHIREIIENTVFTNSEAPTHGADNTTGVYDGRALELDSIEPVQKMPTATNLNPVTVLRNSDHSARYKHPSSGNVTADT